MKIFFLQFNFLILKIIQLIFEYFLKLRTIQ